MARLETELTDIKRELGHFKKIDETLKLMKEGLKEHDTRIIDIEDNMENLRDYSNKQEDAIATMEYNRNETILRIRGVTEVEGEVLMERLMPTLQEIWDMEEKEVKREIDRLYRVNSRVARDKKLPRDIILSCVRKCLRDEVLRFHSRQPLQIDGKRLIILKEVPLSIQRRRKDYKLLTDMLRSNNITFRWIIPEGISFMLEGKRHNILTVARAQEIAQKLRRSLQEEDNSPNYSSKAVEDRYDTNIGGVANKSTELVHNGQSILSDQGKSGR
ncbi:uncharacterized protein LOC125427530 [Sphaerodactylus townsendi]|uniref:uncharacterized protein LOC125427530 n=1 Tax=Sphaerodactylus townsendi TaxID=933632 RepID=UPI00202648CD|nr:uncharacterized protein LOC125427530 [Sphaerodactylus townsendi]